MNVRGTWSLVVALAALAGCASMEPGRGFDEVRREVVARTGAETGWDRGTPEDALARDAWRSLLARELSGDEAVQVALLNNRDLVATYEELDIAQADLVRAGLLRNPIFSGELRLDADGGASVALGVTEEFAALLTMPLRKARAGAAFESAKARVIRAAVDVAYEARMALQDYQAAEQLLELRLSSARAAEASRELARRLLDAGTLRRIEYLSEQSALDEAELDVEDARDRVAAARERVNVALGLWGEDTSWSAAARLPELPDDDDVADVEGRAVASSLEIAEARWTIEAALAAARSARPVALLDGVDVGAAAERDPESGWSVGPSFAVPIPIFDAGGAAAGEAEAIARQAERRLYAVAVEVRAAARAAAQHLSSSRRRCERLRDSVVPVHEGIVEETQLQYNAMQVSVFRLLQARREQVDASAELIEATRAYWSARAGLMRILAGGSVAWPEGRGAGRPRASSGSDGPPHRD